MGKKNSFEKNKIYDAIVVSFFCFFSCLLRSVEAQALIRLIYTVQHCLMEFEFDDC